MTELKPGQLTMVTLVFAVLFSCALGHPVGGPGERAGAIAHGGGSGRGWGGTARRRVSCAAFLAPRAGSAPPAAPSRVCLAAGGGFGGTVSPKTASVVPGKGGKAAAKAAKSKAAKSKAAKARGKGEAPLKAVSQTMEDVMRLFNAISAEVAEDNRSLGELLQLANANNLDLKIDPAALAAIPGGAAAAAYPASEAAAAATEPRAEETAGAAVRAVIRDAYVAAEGGGKIFFVGKLAARVAPRTPAEVGAADDDDGECERVARAVAAAAVEGRALLWSHARLLEPGLSVGKPKPRLELALAPRNSEVAVAKGEQALVWVDGATAEAEAEAAGMGAAAVAPVPEFGFMPEQYDEGESIFFLRRETAAAAAVAAAVAQ